MRTRKKITRRRKKRNLVQLLKLKQKTMLNSNLKMLMKQKRGQHLPNLRSQSQLN